MKRWILALLWAAAAALPAAADNGYLRAWLVSGPYPDDDAAARLKLPRLPDEAGAAPRPGDAVASGGPAWKPYRSPNDVIDLLADPIGFGCRSNAVAYAFTYVDSPSARDAELRLGSDDGVAAWLNGEPVWFNDARRGVTPDEDRAPVRLAQGWNLLLIKVSQGSGPWAFAARFTDASGRAMPDLGTAIPEPALPAAPHPPSHPIAALGLQVDAPVVEKDGSVRYGVHVRVRNLGPGPVARASVAPAGGAPPALPQEAGPLAAWERKSVRFDLSLDDVLAWLKAADAGVEVRVGDASARTAMADEIAAHVFASALQPIRIGAWRVLKRDAAGAEQPAFADAALDPVAPGQEVAPEGPALWLRARVNVPRPLAEATLALAVDRAGAKAEVYLDGQRAGEAGGAPLPFAPAPGGNVIAIKIEADSGKPLRLPEARLEMADPAARYCAANLDFFEEVFPDLRGETRRRRREAAAAFASGGVRAFQASLAGLADFLRERAQGLKDYTVWYVGQSHIDLVSLWRWDDAIRIVKQTFGRAVDFAREHPEYTYAQGQAAAYAAAEQYDPELFARVRQAVKEGRWSVVGGMWVEPDVTLPSGESLVRQLLYGKRWFLERFGVDVKVGWNPEAFGHSPQLPQIYKKSGVDAYCFARCGGDRGLFWWEGLDGSRILCRAAGPLPPGPVAVQSALAAGRQAGVKEVLNTYGAANQGGGPSREDLQAIDRLRAKDLFPRVTYGTPERYFAKVAGAAGIPVVKGELGFVCEGGYTTHAAVKRANRAGENLLGAAEAAAAVAQPFGHAYDRKAFEQLWRIVLFNQGHELLPGGAVREVYADAERDAEEVSRGGEATLRAALDALAASVRTEGEGIPVIVFNSLGWARTEAVEATVPYAGPVATLGVFDETGREVPSQVGAGGAGYRPTRLLFLARDVPSMGYRVFWARDAGAAKQPFAPIAVSPGGGKIESERYVIELDPASGCIVRLFDKAAGREALASAAAPERNGERNPAADPKPPLGNLLQLEGDRGRDSAWSFTYTGERWNLDRGARLEVIERGPVRAVVRVTRTFKDERPEYSFGRPSTFQQDLAVYGGGAPRIDLVHEIDWYERYKVLKLAFPAAARAETAAAEVAYGAVERPAKGADYPTLNWIDLSDAAGGLSVLNDGKQGYDASGAVLRVHLLRGSFDPDPEPDKGRHRFTIALVPHAGDWRKAETPRRAWELNRPPAAWAARPHAGPLPPSLSFVSVDAPNVNLVAVKRAEDSDALVLRFYEAHGAAATAKVKFWKPLEKAVETDLLERDGKEIPASGDTLELPMGAFEIKTVKVTLK